MEKPYLLIDVFDREITTMQFATLKEAQDKMLDELEQFGGVTAPAIGMESDSFQINEMSAWSNYRGASDWLIVELDH